MGYDIEGILFYGVMVDDEPNIMHAWDIGAGGMDWEEYYANKKGLPYPEDLSRNSMREYLDKRRQLLIKAGCTIDWHGDNDSYMVYVALTDHNHKGGKPSKVIGSLDVPQDADEKIKAFCEVMGLKYEYPQWWLTGSRG